jgi:WD40 repeat protein
MKRKLQTTKTTHSSKRQAGEITFVAFSPDRKFALSGSWDNALKLWHILTLN